MMRILMPGFGRPNKRFVAYQVLNPRLIMGQDRTVRMVVDGGHVRFEPAGASRSQIKPSNRSSKKGLRIRSAESDLTDSDSDNLNFGIRAGLDPESGSFGLQAGIGSDGDLSSEVGAGAESDAEEAEVDAKVRASN